MKVKVLGPNLSSAAQKKGETHVHAADCGDLAKYGPGRPMGGDVPGDREPTVEMRTRREVVEYIYPPGDFDYDADTEWQDYDDLYVAPCVEFETA